MSEPTDDLSALAWVYEEVRRSLEAAHKALRRFVKESEALAGSDVDVVDPSVLRSARVHVHQSAGALELVGLAPLATVLRASEAAIVRYVAKPQKLTPQAVDHLERASFALLDYIGRVLGGKQVSSLALFPQYRAVQEDAGADRVHPADLWDVGWRWAALPRDKSAKPRGLDATTRSAIEQEFLSLMKLAQPRDAARRLSDTFAALSEGSSAERAATSWKLAAAVFQAQADGLLGFDVYSKRLGSRLLAQFRSLARGESDLSERLALDLLFFCAQAKPATEKSPRVAAAQKAYGLEKHVPADYAVSPLGRYDPAWVMQARKRVTAAKESWSAVAGGEMHRLPGLTEQFSLVGDSLKRLFPLGETIASELHDTVAQTQDSGAAPPAQLAMEVATSILYIEAVLEDAEFDHPELAGRVQRLAHRLAAVRQGKSPEPLEIWMEELYRRVSDRQTMGSVVQELRSSLSEAEKLIDQFFRDTSDSKPLIQVPKHLSAMRGVLSVLGMDHASAALVRMRDEVDGLASTEIDLQRVAQAGVFDRLAGNLGALGFLIDMLSVQPQMAKSLFVFDTVAGSLNPIMGRGENHSELTAHAAQAGSALEQQLLDQAQKLAHDATQSDVSSADLARSLERLTQGASAADRSGLAEVTRQAQRALTQAKDEAGMLAARDRLSKAMADFVAPVSPAGAPDGAAGHASKTAPLAAGPGAAVDIGQDEELREIFLEEAREVLGTAYGALGELSQAPGELPLLTTIRRAFHTLKGSSRMVGLKDFGEAAWTCEKLYNTRLADQRPADQELLQFTGWALGYLGTWVDEIALRRPTEHSAADVARHALAHQEGRRDAGATSQSPPHLAPISVPQNLPTEPAPFVPSRPMRSAEPALPKLEFSFDLDLPDDGGPASGFSSLPAGEVQEADESALALFDPFDPKATEVLPLPETLENPVADIDIDFIDLDLGQEFHSVSPGLVDEPRRIMVAAEPHAPDLAPPIPFGAATPAFPSPHLEPSVLGAPEFEAAESDSQELGDSEMVKVIGALRISIPLFNIYLNEADELSRRLTTELAEWAMELHRPIGEIPIALAHSLAGSSATVGFANLSHLARTLEHALTRSQAIGRGTPQEARLFVDAAEEIRRLLHQFAAGFLKDPSVTLLSRLDEHELSSARWLEAVTAAADIPPNAADSGYSQDFIAPFEPLPDAMPVAPAEPPKAAPVELPASPALGSVKLEPPAPVPLVAPPAMPATPVAPTKAPAPEAELPAEPRQSMPSSTARDKPAARAPAAADTGFEADAESLRTWFEPSGFMEWKSLTYPAPAPGAAGTAGAPEVGADGPSADATMPAGALADDRRQAPRRSATLVDSAPDTEDDVDAEDAVDAELFPIFEEEALELLPQLAGQLRSWIAQPAATSHADGCMRTLHTLKGGARLAGAMRLGELAHRLETRIERILAQTNIATADVEKLHSHCDALSQVFDALRNRDAQAYAQATEAIGQQSTLQTLDSSGLASTQASPQDEDAVDAATTRAQSLEPLEPMAELAVPIVKPLRGEDLPAAPRVEPALRAAVDGSGGIDWSRFANTDAAAKPAAERATGVSQSAVRVRAPLLDRLVNQAGEVSIARTRIESEVNHIKGSLSDLTDNLERLRAQLRDIELQAETQMTSRIEAAKVASQTFDPLEFDRFTRFQEVTRMMAESVNDVATVQRNLQRSLESAEDELVAQARMTRELQGDLLRTRMVEFEGLSDRLYRVVRQAAKETGKQVRLDIVGGSIEIDRGVLDRMTGAFEHVLRNSVTHGIELPDARSAEGKDPTGLIVVTVTQEANEVGVEFRDDGAGLNLARIRERGVAMGLLDPARQYNDAELANLIFASGFSTATSVTELAGRGVGMDVVRSEVNAIGGRIRTATRAKQGTSFKLILPLTTAVTQVLMLRCGETAVAVPSTLIEIVRRATPAEIEQAHTAGTYLLGERVMPFFWLGSLLQLSPQSTESVGRTRTVVVIRSAQKRIAVQVDEVLGNQEVVVKNLGPQLSRVPGLAGITLLASGAVALIYNPVALATLYGEPARQVTLAALQAPAATAGRGNSVDATPVAPMVLVVDDSLTVRRVTQRLLVREGYRVVLAKDGLDALERLAEERPQVVLSDIEMPRMDGFDLVRNIRSNPSLRDLPVIMITSRIAQKHRDHAAELGVDHYMGKPYSEEDLLALIGHYAGSLSAA